MPGIWKSDTASSGIWRGAIWRSSVSVLGSRLTVSGSTLLDPNNNSIFLHGTNQGTWGQNYSIDAPAIASYGANIVRLVLRWQGNYGGTIDCYSSNVADDYIDPAHLTQFLQEIDWAIAAGLWVVVAFDSDYGAGNRGLGTADWNFFDTTDTANKTLYTAQFTVAWQRLARELLYRDKIAFLELLPEPMPTGSNAGHAAGLRTFYTNLADAVRTVDANTPFLIGPRDSYGLNSLDEAYLSTRTDIVYTADFLTNKVEAESTIAGQAETFAAFRTTNNVPIFGQQVGRRTVEDEGNTTTSENTGLTAFNGVFSLFNARQIPYTHWQYHQNTNSPDEYALWYKTVYPGDGADNWTPKTNEINAFTYHMGQSGAALETAAIAAATAASARLFYVKSDLSNVWQTNDTSTPVTAVGQNVGRIEPVVGGGNFSQATIGLRPTLAASVNGYAMQFTAATNMWMGLDTTYFASGDDTIVIVAARAATSAANRVLFQTGTSGTNVRNPYLAVIATDEVQASWRGDDTIATGAQTTTTCDDRAIVASATKIGADKKVFLNGVQEGTTDTTAVGAMASITRTRFGATTGGTNGFGGPIALVCVSKTMTDEQRRAIERWGAWLVAAPFRGAIPA